MLMTVDETKYLVDGLSVGTAVGTLMGFLPAIAALLTIIWTAIRIYETETVQRLLDNRKKCKTDDE